MLRRHVILALALLPPAFVQAQERSITVASTTSTEQSGLFGHILPEFTVKTGITVKVVALGTGQALEVGRGDADVVFVHDKAAEEKFVAEGFATKRLEMMYNDFIIVGPKDDPRRHRAGTCSKGCGASRPRRHLSSPEAIVREPIPPNSDTGRTLASASPLRGEWYKEIGQGMGPALNTAVAMNAYVFADRGTWLSFKNRRELAILVEGDQRLFNQYGVMLVNATKHPHVKAADGQALIDWLISPEDNGRLGLTRSKASSSFPERGRLGTLVTRALLLPGLAAVALSTSLAQADRGALALGRLRRRWGATYGWRPRPPGRGGLGPRSSRRGQAYRAGQNARLRPS